MTNTQKQPADPPSEGAGPGDNPAGQGRNGIPDGQHRQDANSLPNDDRHDTETAPSRIEDEDKT